MRLGRLTTSVLTTLGATALGLGLLAAPAQAASMPVRLGWNITATHFGAYALHDTLGVAAKRSHTDYRAQLRPQLVTALRGSKAACKADPYRALRLIVKQAPAVVINASQNVYAVVALPCSQVGMGITTYERRYKPYTNTRIVGYMAKMNGEHNSYLGGRGSDYLPHTSSVYIDYGYDMVKSAYGSKLGDYTKRYADENGVKSHYGYLATFKSATDRAAGRQPQIYFYSWQDSIAGIGIGVTLFED